MWVFHLVYKIIQTQVVWKGSETVGFGKASKGTIIAIVALYNPAGNMIGAFDENVELSPENTPTEIVTTEGTQTPSWTPEGASTASMSPVVTTPSVSPGTPAPDVFESIEEKLELLIEIFRERINKM